MTLNFGDVWARWPELLNGTLATIGLALAGMTLALAIGVSGVAIRQSGNRFLSAIVIGFVEIVRNTPFLVQIFFIFFVLPNLGIRLNPTTTAIIALGINGGAYAIEIIRGGVEAINRGQIEAGLALGLHPGQVYRMIVLKPALRSIYPSLTSQFILLTLTTSICSSIAAFELTSIAQRIESDTFRSFEVYFTITVIYLLISWLMMTLFAAIARLAFHYPTALREEKHMQSLGLPEIAFLFKGLQWTVFLTVLGFVGGIVFGLIIALLRTAKTPVLRYPALAYISVFQGTPLLMQLFLVYFGLPLTGVDVSPWLAVAIALTAHASAFLGEIWRGAIQAVPSGQSEASHALGLSYRTRMREIILPQALRLSLPATIGFLVQLLKGTSLAAIVGFIELTRAGQIVSNQIYQPVLVFSVVGAIYFALCWPLSFWGGRMERRLARSTSR